jgi:prepilin-type N-terminal cleavage/methylation domain-containing protein
MKERGFTAIELVIALVLVGVVGYLLWMQKDDFDARDRDDARKVAINSIYYHLEDVFYPANKYYPERLTTATLKGLDPDILKDPSGVSINEQHSTYRYEGLACMNAQCKGYMIRANLEKEADFIKDSVN